VKIKYTINNLDYHITFCSKKSKNNISKSLDKIKSDKNILLLYDEKVNKNIVNEVREDLKLSGCNIHLMKCEGNKINKNEKFLFRILDFLIKKKFTKRSVIISFGGGVVGDVSALASSLYLRGLYYYNIPSTMTAIIDSCVGGKTAINYKGITNSIGTYYHPINVFILEDIIRELPNREFYAGLAEVIKCGVIDDQNILKFLKKNKEKIISREYNCISKLCYLTLKSKIKFFINDIYENNKRLYLNFGHTIAHAIEMGIENNLKKDFIRHGEAVGLGILSEIFYANKGKNKLYNTVKNYLDDFMLPTSLKIKNIPIDSTTLQNCIYQNIFLDKKKIDKFPRYICIKKQGKPSVKEIKDFDFLNDTIVELMK
jgi:3-dehydroquinate synthase|tara:strand:- start:152 stop:1264 length:1113 start_codon:yes stop_codon:yes gene_type:complete